VKSIDGISYYQVGSGSAGLLVCPDVWGWNGGRTRAVADDLAKKGLSVWVPKLLPAYEGGTDGDGLPPNFDIGARMSEIGPLVGGDWNPSKVVPKCLKIIKAMDHAGVKKKGVLGFCFGGWIGMHLSKQVDFVCGASPHPSVHMEGMIGGDPAALASESKCPFAFYPAGVAGEKGGDPDVYDEDGAVFKALEEKFKRKNETKRFSKMLHGWVVRGSIKPDEHNCGTGDDVKVAVQECLEDICRFFSRRGLMRLKKGEVPPKLRKPKFGKVQKLLPDSKGINLQLKCASIEEIKNEEGKEGLKMWQAVLGDDTGVVTFRLRDQKYIDMCQVGSSVVVQNARISMVKGHIHVIIDKWGVMRAAEKAWEFEPNTAKSITATEYELTKE